MCVARMYALPPPMLDSFFPRGRRLQNKGIHACHVSGTGLCANARSSTCHQQRCAAKHVSRAIPACTAPASPIACVARVGHDGSRPITRTTGGTVNGPMAAGPAGASLRRSRRSRRRRRRRRRGVFEEKAVEIETGYLLPGGLGLVISSAHSREYVPVALADRREELGVAAQNVHLLRALARRFGYRSNAIQAWTQLRLWESPEHAPRSGFDDGLQHFAYGGLSPCVC